MRDIWNPRRGCRKVGEGCRHCMYFLDRRYGGNGAAAVPAISMVRCNATVMEVIDSKLTGVRGLPPSGTRAFRRIFFIRPIEK